MAKSNLGRKAVISSYSSRQQSVTEGLSPGTLAREEPGGGNWSRSHGGTLLTHWLALSMACSVRFPTTQAFLPKGGSTHSVLGPPPAIMIHDSRKLPTDGERGHFLN